jgi:5'-3' exonuclease
MKLLAVDFSNLIIRHAANPYGNATDEAGRSVQGPVGAIGQVIRILEAQKPTHLLIARDGKRADSFRRELDTNYKAHRTDQDDDIKRQFILAYQALEVLGWPVQSVHQHEADDVIASACVQFPGQARVVTGDKDMLALCSEMTKIILLKPGHQEEVDIEGCTNIYGVGPERVQDYKALVGDSSDGIVGVRGIGPKTTVQLLSHFDTLDGIYQAIADKEELPPFTKHIIRKLHQGKESAYLSYQLAGLICDLDINFESLLSPGIPSDDRYGKELDALGLHAVRMHLRGGPKPHSKAAKQPMDLKQTFDALKF